MIEVQHLTKEFKKIEKEPGLRGMLKAIFKAKTSIKKAVDDVSFTINKGEIVGYIGANGAGKSTTIKMLTGILNPTSGTIKVNGLVPFEDRVKNAYQIGVVFGQRTQLWWDLPLGESFTILKEIYGISDTDYQERFSFFDELFNLKEFIRSPVRTLSLGQRMRADIAASLLHNPQILFLDEPTIGLDVVAKHQMREAIKMMNKKYQTTVILTTHDLDDIAELCSRILIIDNGKIIYEGTLQEIKDTFGFMKTVTFELAEGVPSEPISLEMFKLPSEDLHSEIKEGKVLVHFNKKKITVTQVAQVMMANYRVSDMSVAEPDIETLVGNIYQGKAIL